MTLVWQEPFSALYARLRQDHLQQLAAHGRTRAADRRRAARRSRGSPTSAGGSPSSPANSSATPATASAVGRIVIPRIGASYVVVKGTDTAALKSGPGVYSGNALPGDRRDDGDRRAPDHLPGAVPPHRLARARAIASCCTCPTRTSPTPSSASASSRRPTSGGGRRASATNALVLSACTPLFSAAKRLLVYARLTAHRAGRRRALAARRGAAASARSSARACRLAARPLPAVLESLEPHASPRSSDSDSPGSPASTSPIQLTRDAPTSARALDALAVARRRRRSTARSLRRRPPQAARRARRAPRRPRRRPVAAAGARARCAGCTPLARGEVRGVAREPVGEVDHRVHAGARPAPGPRAGAAAGRRARASAASLAGVRGARPAISTASPAPAPPSAPVTPTRSPARAPSRPTSCSSRSAQPTTVTETISAGARDDVAAGDRRRRSARASSLARRAPARARGARRTAGQAEHEVGLAGVRAHRGEVRERARKRPVADLAGARPALLEAEVHALDHRVDRGHAQRPRARTTAASSPMPRTTPARSRCAARCQLGGDRFDQGALGDAVNRSGSAQRCR